jgi:uncharacterized membrane protein
VDKKEIAKLLGGTIARGLLWAAAALAAKVGVETIGEDVATGLGNFIGAVVVALVAAWWSKRKDAKLLTAEPPK